MTYLRKNEKLSQRMDAFFSLFFFFSPGVEYLIRLRLKNRLL